MRLFVMSLAIVASLVGCTHHQPREDHRAPAGTEEAGRAQPGVGGISETPQKLTAATLAKSIIETFRSGRGFTRFEGVLTYEGQEKPGVCVVNTMIDENLLALSITDKSHSPEEFLFKATIFSAGDMAALGLEQTIWMEPNNQINMKSTEQDKSYQLKIIDFSRLIGEYSLAVSSKDFRWIKMFSKKHFKTLKYTCTDLKKTQ